jgi:uncharacterized SAM-binding protein YcdF (DUF218 family)
MKTIIKNKILLLGLMTSVLVYFSAMGYILLNAEKETLQNSKADIAVILGTTSYWGDEINPCLKARVLKGVQLFKEGQVKAIIVSGGTQSGNKIPGAAVMKQIAVDAGMDAAYIFEEGKATSTYENIEYSKAGLDYYQAKKVVIVTEPYHSPRGMLVADKLLQQEVYSAPATMSPCWETNRFTHNYFLREPFVLIYYFLTGKI